MLAVAVALVEEAALESRRSPLGCCALDVEAPARNRDRGRPPRGKDGRAGARDRLSTAGERRAAIADVALVGAARAGDEVVVNVQALDLDLGSGGFDIVHVNLTRGLEGEGEEGASVMKLNYTSIQHAVVPVDATP